MAYNELRSQFESKKHRQNFSQKSKMMRRLLNEHLGKKHLLPHLNEFDTFSLVLLGTSLVISLAISLVTSLIPPLSLIIV